jgi:hypothetical protein
MIAFLIPFILILTATFALLVGAIRAQPYDDKGLHLLLAEGECWQGICVDVSRRDDVLRTLESHPWVGEIFETDLHISWRWSGSQPSMIDASQDGLLRITGGIVRQIRVRTHLRFGDVWMALDRPDGAVLVRPVSRYSVYQMALYELEGLQAITTINCPIDPDSFWMATTTFGYGELHTTEAINGIRFDIYDTSSWWRNLRRCRQ